MRQLAIALALVLTAASYSHADLVIFGVTDGDLTGGNPKSILLSATADIADLSIYGVGSANNGGGTDGQEFTLSGSVTSGTVIVIPGNGDSSTFFSSNYTGFNLQNTTGNFVASINGDDAVELFMNGSVIDTYGDPDTNGDGESWDYTDGYAVRTGGAAGAFSQSNYTSVFQGFDGLDEAAHISSISSTFGLTVAVPEASSFLFGGLSLAMAGLSYARRRRG